DVDQKLACRHDCLLPPYYGARARPQLTVPDLSVRILQAIPNAAQSIRRVRCSRVSAPSEWRLSDRFGSMPELLSVDNMNTKVSRRESLNGAAEPGRDLLEIDVFDGTQSVRAKHRCNANRLETADRTFINFLKLFGPLRF